MRIGVDARPLTGMKAGIGHYVSSLLREFARLDTENEYLLYAPFPVEHGLTADNMHTRIIPGSRSVWWVQKTLPGALAGDAVDLFWGNNYALPLLPVHSGNGFCKKAVTVHDLIFYRYPRLVPRRTLMHLRLALPLYLKQADAIIAVSHNTARDLKEIYGIPGERVTVTHLASRFESLGNKPEGQAETIRKKYGLPEDYLLYVGTVEARKGIDTVIRALSHIRNSNNRIVFLVVAGQPGWKDKELKKTAEDSSLKEQVLFTGYVEDKDLPFLYRGATAFLYPSVYEGFGMPVLESMSLGVPVITTRISALPELAGDAALYVEPGDVSGLAVAILKLISDPLLRKELAHKGKQQAAKFSWERTAIKTLQVFREVTEQ